MRELPNLFGALDGRQRKGRRKMKYVYCIFKYDKTLLKICENAEVAIDERDKLCEEQGYSPQYLIIEKKELITK
jgi:hypothetical protein